LIYIAGGNNFFKNNSNEKRPDKKQNFDQH
jgi:hypothetical protein